jgi:hypothetical protein
MTDQTKGGSATLLKRVEGSGFSELASGHSSNGAYPFTGNDQGFCVRKRIDGSVDVSGDVDFCTAESFRTALSQVIPSPAPL